MCKIRCSLHHSSYHNRAVVLLNLLIVLWMTLIHSYIARRSNNRKYRNMWPVQLVNRDPPNGGVLSATLKMSSPCAPLAHLASSKAAKCTNWAKLFSLKNHHPRLLFRTTLLLVLNHLAKSLKLARDVWKSRVLRNANSKISKWSIRWALCTQIRQLKLRTTCHMLSLLLHPQIRNSSSVHLLRKTCSTMKPLKQRNSNSVPNLTN